MTASKSILWAAGSVVAIGLVLGGPAEAKRPKKSQETFDVQALCDRQFAEGLEYKKNSRFVDAKESFTAVIEACPDYLKAYLQLGNIAISLRDYDGAIEHYSKALELDAENLEVKEALAYAYTASGKVEEAEDLYLQVLDKDPTRVGAIQNLAFTYEKESKLPESTMMYAHALTLDPSLTKIEDELARKYLDQKLYGQALFFYNKLAAREPDNLDIQRKIAYFHYRMKDYAGAIPLYEALLQKEPEGADALNEHKILAFCADKVGKPEIAFPHYDYIIAHEPGEMKNYYLYASALVDGGKLDKAWAVSEQGLKVNANWGCLTYVKGEILEQRGLAEEKTKGYDKARDFFKQAKATFERATGDAQCGGNAVKQLDRMDAQIDRVNKMQEKEGLQ